MYSHILNALESIFRIMKIILESLISNNLTHAQLSFSIHARRNFRGNYFTFHLVSGNQFRSKKKKKKKMVIKTSLPLIKSVNRGIQFRRVRWSHYCAKLPLPPPIFTCALRFTNLRGVSRSSFPCFRSFSMFCRREIGENDSILAR